MCGWALNDQHGVPVVPEADGTDGEDDKGVKRQHTHEAVWLCIVQKVLDLLGMWCLFVPWCVERVGVWRSWECGSVVVCMCRQG